MKPKSFLSEEKLNKLLNDIMKPSEFSIPRVVDYLISLENDYLKTNPKFYERFYKVLDNATSKELYLTNEILIANPHLKFENATSERYRNLEVVKSIVKERVDELGSNSKTDTNVSRKKPKNEEIENYENLTFEDVFHKQDEIEFILKVCRDLQILDDEYKFKGRLKNRILAIIHVLKSRKKIKNLDDKILAPLFAKKFGTTISDRAIRDRPNYYDELRKELKVQIQESIKK